MMSNGSHINVDNIEEDIKMDKNIDYEQLYYDAIYENRKLKERINELESEIQDINACRTKRNIDLQKYILLQLKK